MRRNRLVLLMARLVGVRDASPARDASPIDPSLLPRDLANWRAPR